MAKLYKYVGSGAYVPGLPLEITDERAKERGSEKLLQECIKAGLYVLVTKTKKKQPAEEVK